MDCSPQAPLSMGFSRQEYWSGLPFPSPGDLPNPGIEPGPPALQADSLPSEAPGKPRVRRVQQNSKGVILMICSVSFLPNTWLLGCSEKGCRHKSLKESHFHSKDMACHCPGVATWGAVQLWVEGRRQVGHKACGWREARAWVWTA